MENKQEVNPFKNIATCRGLSGQILFAMDAESVPGKTLCHFVRLETIEMDDNISEIPDGWLKLENKSDPRLEHLASCFTKPASEAVQHCFKVLFPLMGAVEGFLKLPIAVGPKSLRGQAAAALMGAVALLQTKPETAKTDDDGKPVV